ncbi:MAG: hypothetical protein ACLU6H_04555 [Lachnospiraceae bacterium]
MKITMNFSLEADDLGRYTDSTDLRRFYQSFGLSGLELMPLGEDPAHLVEKDMIVGVHLRCITDWMDLDKDMLIEHYRKDLEYARLINAGYVVFHVTQVGFAESLVYAMKHTDAEVVDAAAAFINELLDGHDYPFWFLMENLWWPGLNMLDARITERLLAQVHYAKKGLMLDTGHFMNSNYELETPADALAYLHQMLDEHEALLPMIRGIHLNQSLSGHYMKDYRKHPLIPKTDPTELATQTFLHIFQVDQHRPFVALGVRELVSRIDPDYVTLEYITRNRKEHAQFLKAGTDALKPVTTVRELAARSSI